MIFACANSYTAIQSAAAYPTLGTSAGLGLPCGTGERPAQGCAGYTGIARADWGQLPGGSVYK